jgi:hypothetical protein
MTSPAPDPVALPDADTCERIIVAALADGDIAGVGAALRLMSVQDPHRAEHLRNVMRLGVAIADGGTR